MAQAITDTGPILHLHEIGSLAVFRQFASGLAVPDRVAVELQARGLSMADISAAGVAAIRLEPYSVDPAFQREASGLQAADLEVAAIACDFSFSRLVLTDDLALRRWLERRGNVVVGSVGLLLRACHLGILDRHELEVGMDRLLSSSLHLTSALRAYVRARVRDLGD